MSDEEWDNFGEKLGTVLLAAILLLFLLLSLLTQGCAGRAVRHMPNPNFHVTRPRTIRR